MEYIDAKLNDIASLKDKISFLFVTATLTETKEFHSRLNSKNSYPILRIHIEKQTHYLGYFGNFLVIHVQSDMGAIGRQSSIMTTASAIDLWKPKAVVMPGIAFGIDPEKQSIGDVLVSESLAPYNFQKISKKETIYRAPVPPSGTLLLNKFKNISPSWKFEGEEVPNVEFTCMLSGESLIDNLEYRNNLLKAFPTSKGGEMEGAGIYAAANSKDLEWIIVKSICDFADGNKSDEKQSKQALATKTSLSLCEFVLSTNNAFDSLGCIEFLPDDQVLTLSEPVVPDLNEVIFDIYYSKNESFYVSRNIDIEFQGVVGLYSVWLYGDSGNGKTSIIRRYLELSDIESVYVTLGSCHDCSSNQILNYILYELEERQNNELNEIPSHPTPVISRKIYRSFKALLGQKTGGYIYIDEIPLSDESEFSSFLQSIVGVLQYAKTQNDNINIKILLSSIRCASKAGTELNNVSENIKFIKIESWESTDIEALYELIVSELAIRGLEAEKDKILGAAKGSPRFVKNLLKYHIARPDSTIDNLIDVTNRELGR